MPNKTYKNQDEKRLYLALGPSISEALVDPHVTEIMLNPDGRLFFDIHIEGMCEAGFMDATTAQTLIMTIAGLVDYEIKRHSPIISTEIPYDRSRFEGLLPPLVKAPCFCIRKHNALSLSLDELTLTGMMKTYERELLDEALATHQNLLICGGTGCGKTTLINALLDEIGTLAPYERIICIEDTRELQLKLKNTLSLLANEQVSISTLLRSTLRLRPDRIIIGEVRGAEALDLLDTLCSGHQGGIASLHAGSIHQCLKRLTLLVTRHPQAPKKIEPLIAEAIDLIVLLASEPSRHIQDIVRLCDFDGQNFVFEHLGRK